MQKMFMNDDFCLSNETSAKLYHEHAKNQPIIDYHNHLPVEDIASDRQFKTITEAALEGDHYKWRAMRGNGIEEKHITGSATDHEKWSAWARTIPYTLRNPLYVWQHLELKGYFGIEELLKPETADAIYEQCNEHLQHEAFSCQGLLRKMNVEVVCTTDDPAYPLDHHRLIAEKNIGIKVLPTYRPDRILNLDDLSQWKAYLEKLEASSNTSILTYEDLLIALKKRHDAFHDQGCRLSDHGLLYPQASSFSEAEIKHIFQKARESKELTLEEKDQFASALMLEFGKMNHAKNWTMQLHLGPLRNNSSRLSHKIGRDAGFDSMGDRAMAEDLARFLNRLDESNQLPKTILYNLNPKDNHMIATMCGNFMDGSIPGKIQYGSGWWFLDQKDGMEAQLNALSNTGLISRFVGMLTDSRSFLSFPRHEYFRRILCDLFGKDVESGNIPNEPELIGDIIEAICYKNAKAFFEF